jgi:hypothetical protein
MDEFNIIYKILDALKKAMDVENFDAETITNEDFNISRPKFISILLMLKDKGLVKGIQQIKALGYDKIIYKNMRITYEGLEFLSENSAMKKAANMIKGVAEIIF